MIDRIVFHVVADSQWNAKSKEAMEALLITEETGKIRYEGLRSGQVAKNPKKAIENIYSPGAFQAISIEMTNHEMMVEYIQITAE